MSPESGQPNTNAELIHTPESLQECVVLREAIDDQIDTWAVMARSRHPSIVSAGLAGIIVKATEPDAAQLKQASVFSLGPRSEEAQERIAAARRLELISPYALDEDIDAVEPLHTAYVEYFEQLNSFRNNPGVPDTYGSAIDRVHRLFIVREQLALKTGDAAKYSIIGFNTVLNRLVEDVY